jgi:hypothetical protein
MRWLCELLARNFSSSAAGGEEGKGLGGRETTEPYPAPCFVLNLGIATSEPPARNNLNLFHAMHSWSNGLGCAVGQPVTSVWSQDPALSTLRLSQGGANLPTRECPSEHLKDEDVTLTMLDLQMPGLSDPSEIRRLRLLRPEARVVVLSGSDARGLPQSRPPRGIF